MKTKRKKKSIYASLERKSRSIFQRVMQKESLELHKNIRDSRMQKKLSGVELCRRAGDLDPRTLTAVEKGRIRNPSLKTLSSISRGLGVTVSSLFQQAELDFERNFHVGSQKGEFQVNFPRWGAKMVSFTPFIREFFCGKLVLGARKKIDETFLDHTQPLFVATLVGRFDIQVADRKISLKAGENLFFNGALKHSVANPLHRESVLLMITAPSFF